MNGRIFGFVLLLIVLTLLVLYTIKTDMVNERKVGLEGSKSQLRPSNS